MVDALADLAYGIVATAPSPATSGTTLTLQSGQGARFPAQPFDLLFWPPNVIPLITNAEMARCGGVSGDVLTFTRAQYGTSAQTVAVGWQVCQPINKNLLTQIAAGGGAVSSVFGRTGTVTAQTGDYTAAQVGADASGAAAAVQALALLKANNLSDLPNAGTSRANLGLGTAATQASSAFDAAGAAAAAQAASDPVGSATTALGTAETFATAAVAVETSRATTAEALALPKTGGTMSGAIAMGSNKITGLTNGSSAQDAAAFGQIVTNTSLGTGINHQSLTASVSGTADYYEIVNGTHFKQYVLILNAWDDVGQTLTFTTAFTADVPGYMSTPGIPTVMNPTPGNVTKTTFVLPSTSAAAITGVFVLMGV